ncbi:putative phosphinothricin acetyltransferase YwnH [compost metagenome]
MRVRDNTMFEHYTIEDAVIDDLESIVAIYNETIESRMVTADLEPVSVESRHSWFNEHSPQFRPLWVVKSDGKIVAWLSFQSFYGRLAYLATAEISIYITNKYRSLGIGSILIEKAIQACPRLSINTLLGFVFAHNEPSLSLLKKFGFVQWAYLPKVAKLDEVERDLVILGKRVVENAMDGMEK